MATPGSGWSSRQRLTVAVFGPAVICQAISVSLQPPFFPNEVGPGPGIQAAFTRGEGVGWVVFICFSWCAIKLKGKWGIPWYLENVYNTPACLAHCKFVHIVKSSTAQWNEIWRIYLFVCSLAHLQKLIFWVIALSKWLLTSISSHVKWLRNYRLRTFVWTGHFDCASLWE